MFSRELIDAIRSVASDCSPEIELDDESFMIEILAEVSIDARRLEIWGHPKEQKEMEHLVQLHGYAAVFQETCRHVTDLIY